jgi:hypothetical protein
MSKFKESAVKTNSENNSFYDNQVENFMGGVSFSINPLDTLRIVAASSIFGEPSYYRDGFKSDAYIKNISDLSNSEFNFVFKDTQSTLDVFTNAIKNSLDFDFKGTLELAARLRSEFNMRLNPSVIFIYACVHPKRVEFNKDKSNAGFMREIGKKIIQRPDDMTNQFEYYTFLKGSKLGLPSMVKRLWSDVLGDLTPYQINKYKSKLLIDLVRISHAQSDSINELMKTGTIKITETEKTWQNLRSEGKTWKEILDTIKMPHMALLMNLRGIFTETNDLDIAKKVCEKLKSGVLYGKQFPYRYLAAYREIDNSVNHSQLIKDSLQECIDISVANFPKLKGKTMCLSDNSGSSWGAVPSEYGSVTVASIANLSSIITALQSDEGYVGLFGDDLCIKSVSKRNGILGQSENFDKIGPTQEGKGGGGTENGIWIFFRDSIDQMVKYDNIFIYSDMQAGHGGLYGVDKKEYEDYQCGGSGCYIDVMKLVTEYRKKVNSKVNVFSVQVAGYSNSVIPENYYRSTILGGWTGKESTYAKSLIDIWDDVDKINKKR